MWYTRDLIIRPVRIMGVGEDVWVNSESDDGDEYFEPCLSEAMPRNSTRAGFGGSRRRGAVDSGQERSGSKGGKKLPPLKPNVTTETGIISNLMTSDLQCSDNSENGVQLNMSGPEDVLSNKPVKTGRRRNGIKPLATITGTGNSSGQARRSSKSKSNDLDSSIPESKSKPRKKLLKPKPPEKQFDTESITMDKELQTTGSATKPQWTNIVKRVQIHKHQSIKGRSKNLKKKDSFLKRPPKSEFVIENTWIPRDPSTISSTSNNKNNNSKKSKRKTSKEKADKTSDNLGLTPEEEGRNYVSESVEPDLVEPRVTKSQVDKHVSAASVTYEGQTVPVLISDPAGQGSTRELERDVSSATETNTPIKIHQMISSPKLNSPKLSYSPKLTSRETTHVNQINVGDFANLRDGSSKQTDGSSTSLNVADYKYQMNKTRFKGASNSVPHYNDKQDNVKKTVAQNDALLAAMSKNRKNRQQNPPIYVSKIEPKSASKSSFLLPTTVPHRNKFMDLLLADDSRPDAHSPGRSTPDSLPRISFGSPIPIQKQSYHDEEEQMTGEISIIVPKLPQLTKTQTQQSLGKISTFSGGSDTQHTEDEPIVIVTNEDGEVNAADTEQDGWESGYSSSSPRLSSLDSRAHALMTPMSSVTAGSVLLEIPNDHRSLTPFSTITNSTYLDHSRPASSFLDVPQFIGGHYDSHDTHRSRYLPECRPPVNKLPAIYSRNDESNDGGSEDHRFDFTPLPLQSVRTSDGEMSD